jgi:exodeoxyribonuclease VII small subunit
MELTYEEAFNEVSAISREIESEKVSIDVLAEKVKRAADLILLCQKKLRATEEEVNRIIDKMDGVD